MNYMICKWVGDENNAAVKATDDINKIFLGIDPSNVIEKIWKHNHKYIRNVETVIKYLELKKKITSDDNVIIQYPLYCISPIGYDKYLNLPHKKMIAYIQDIESYRYFPDDISKLEDELKILKEFDVIIAHNLSMIEFLKRHGVNAKFVNWEICDYLLPKPMNTNQSLPYSICYVGDINRSNFLRVEQYNYHLKMNVYGKLENINLLGNNIYMGEYNPNNADCGLDGCFGLIWEGNSIDTCDGVFGNYMQINNPNRLSMYLSNNIPVITWRNAALADFITKNEVGFVVDSLCDIENILKNMKIEDYLVIKNNTVKIANKIRTGYYARKAFLEALNYSVKDQ